MILKSQNTPKLSLQDQKVRLYKRTDLSLGLPLHRLSGWTVLLNCRMNGV